MRYVANFGKYEATYGSVGGIIVMLLWMWISSIVLLFGAEVNAVIEHKSEEGKRAGARLMGDSGRTNTKTHELGPPDPGRVWENGFDAGRGFTAARARAVAALAALLGAAMWMHRREA